MVLLNFLSEGFGTMARHENNIRARPDKDMQFIDGGAHGVWVIDDQVGDARGRAAFVDGATQPAAIGGEEDAPALSPRQQAHLAARMTGQRNQQERAIPEQVVRGAESRQFGAAKSREQTGSRTKIVRQQGGNVGATEG